jgi:hypothetical protein
MKAVCIKTAAYEQVRHFYQTFCLNDIPGVQMPATRPAAERRAFSSKWDIGANRRIDGLLNAVFRIILV